MKTFNHHHNRFLILALAAISFVSHIAAQSSNQAGDALFFKARIGFDEAKERITGHKFYDDGKKLVIVGIKNIQFWNVETNELLESYPHDIPNLDKFDSTIVFSPDGRKAIVLDSFTFRIIRREKKVSATVWDLQTGKQITVLERPTESIRAAEWSANGETLLTYSGQYNDKRTEVCFWDADSFKLRGAISLEGYVEYKKLTDDGKIFLAKTDQRDTYRIKYGLKDYLTAWDTSSAKPIQNFSSNGDRQNVGRSGNLTADERYVVMHSGYYSTERVSVWKIGGSDMPVYEIFPRKKDGSIRLLAVVGDYFVVLQNKTLELYDAASGKLTMSIPNQKEFTSHPRGFALSPDKQTLIIETCEKAEFYNLPLAKKQLEIDLVCKTDFDPVSTSYRDFDRLSFNDDGDLLLTYSDKTIRIWNARTGELAQTLADPRRVENKKKDKNKDDGLGWSAGWFGGKRLFASGADGKTILLWEIKK